MQLYTPHSRHWLTASPFLAPLCGHTVARIEPVGTCRARLCVLLMDVWRCVQGGDSGVHHCDRQQSPQARTLTAQSQSQLAGRPLRLLCSDCRSLTAALLLVHPRRPTCHSASARSFPARSSAAPPPLPLTTAAVFSTVSCLWPPKAQRTAMAKRYDKEGKMHKLGYINKACDTQSCTHASEEA